MLWKCKPIEHSTIKLKRTQTHFTCNHPTYNPAPVYPNGEHTPEAVSSIYAVASGEQLGVRCLAQGHLSRGIEGGESAVHSLPPHRQSLPDRDSNSQPLDYESDSLPLGHNFPLI